MPFLYPLHRTWERPYVGAGLALYDAMAMLGKYDMGVPKHRHLFRRQVARMAPDLRTDDLTGAIRYYDCQVDDARLVITVARTAASHGAHVATRTQVTGFLREGERVVGVRARDLETGRDLEIRARVVVNAAGVWTDEIQEMVGGRGSLNVQASKGIHLVVPRDRIRSETGFITKTEKSVLFVIPWGRHWIIGTTDTDWNLDKAHPAASRADIDYLLAHVNTILREPLDHEDVEGVYAGLRPLLRGRREPTSKISREHTVVTPVPGLVMIAGGKLTTYRVMARDAIEAAAHSLRTTVNLAVRDSITDRVPLVGATDYETRANQRVLLSRRAGLHVARIDHLLGRFGGMIDDLLALCDERPELAAQLEGAEDYLAAEIVYAVTHEGARHLDDVLTRRTRISIETFDRGIHAARRVAELMAGELGWDEARLERGGRPLPAPGRGGAAEPAQADRPGGRRGPGQRPRHRLSRPRSARGERPAVSEDPCREPLADPTVGRGVRVELVGEGQLGGVRLAVQLPAVQVVRYGSSAARSATMRDSCSRMTVRVRRVGSVGRPRPGSRSSPRRTR